MRAYLSDRAQRTDRVCNRADVTESLQGDRIRQGALAAWALDEATRLVCETEPILPGYRIAGRMLLVSVVDRFEGTMSYMTDDSREALAESLTTFLTESL